jgi:peptide/nickel transport system permease protein
VTVASRTVDPRAQVAERLRRRVRSEERWSQATLWTGAGIVALVALLALVAPIVYPEPNRPDFAATLQSPSWAHPFGTDALGRDVFARTIHGGRVDLTFGIITAYVPLVIGVLVGSIAGYAGGLVDSTIMRVADFVIAFPMMVIVLAIVAVIGAGITAAYVGIFLVGWALYARLARGEMLVLRERQFILAARGLGYSDRRIVMRHAIPNLLRSAIVFSMADVVLNMLTLAGLSYLGLDVAPPTPEWGAIIAEGQSHLLTAWWIATLPGLFMVTTGVGLSLIGDGLADRMGGEFRMAV